MRSITVALIMLGSSLMAYTQADALQGIYWNDEKTAKIEIYTCDGAYCGKIIWMENPRNDDKNPDPALRSRPVQGLTFMTGFQYEAKTKDWRGGKVYASDSGKTYSGKMWLKNDGEILMMRGFVGVSLLGRTAEFTRIRE